MTVWNGSRPNIRSLTISSILPFAGDHWQFCQMLRDEVKTEKY